MIVYIGPLSARTLWSWVEAAADQARPVLLLDGGSGAGKTTFARAVAEHSGAQLVSMDDFYPGWDGLAAASAIVASDVLHPTRPGYRRWDWAASRPGAWRDIDPHAPLIVEGCGAITPFSVKRASFALWLDCPVATRKRRGIERDGEVFAAQWERWAAQERAHVARDRPRDLADVVAEVPEEEPIRAALPKLRKLQPPPPLPRLRKHPGPTMR